MQFANIAVSHLLHQSLALVIVLPCACRCLVTSNMYLAVWEHLYHLVEHILDKLYCLWIGNIQHVAEYASVYLYAVCTVGVAAELGICCAHCTRVSGEFHLGNNLDMTLGCISHNIAALLLGIEIWAVCLVYVITTVYRVNTPRIVAHRTNSCQSWIFLDLETPSLVISKVPVKAVHLVICHYIYHAFDLLDSEIVTAHIEHETTVFKAWSINNAH